MNHDGPGPESVFHRLRYLRSTFRRLEHLATLALPIESRSVLEIGAGIGDFTSFFLDRNCTVTSVEPRAVNVACFRERYDAEPLWPEGRLRIVQSEIAHLDDHRVGAHDVVFSYGVLNQLGDPEDALRISAEHCKELLILEVAVVSGPGLHDDAVRVRDADPADIGGSVQGRGCLPTRRWVHERLETHFEYVYMTLSQPPFDRFRIDWREPTTERPQDRVIFVAARSPLANERLAEGIPDLQYRSP